MAAKEGKVIDVTPQPNTAPPMVSISREDGDA
jgi:hypothetical protein